MQTEDWKKVKNLLSEVLQIDASERQSFLNEARVSGEVRVEVESLLAFEEEAENLMDLSAIEFSKDFLNTNEDSPNVLTGQKIGVYEIVRELGYGGMGAVYLAERTDGKFKQTVALKLLKREMNTAALRRRFRQEREILESLEHPNIARLLDAGTTDDKIPYIAMEFVEGLPINEFCRRNDLDLRARLDLFRKVCAAIDFAHRRLIVHRDLKPSNILVNTEGVPKLLDFGISKILSSDFEQLNSATVTKLGVMTPSYASPEQLQGKSVTTATDIYSLGVILCELLSGHRPFEEKEANLKEIYKAVIETEPPLPSRIWSSGFGSAMSYGDKASAKNDFSESATRKISDQNTFESKLQTNSNPAIPNPELLRGDLDNIILKALRKEPERRYSTAENLSDDIKRYLQGLPVTARPNTISYRAEKFIRRNKASVVAFLLILLAIIGGIIATLWQARVAQAERVKAEKRFNDVRALANSFLFEFSPKIENLPGSTPARELLVKRALEYLDNLSKEAGDDSTLRRELAAAYEKVGDVQGNPANPNLGDTKGALGSYEKALALREKTLAENPNDLTAQNDLTTTYKGIAEIYKYGETAEKADVYFDKALALQERILERQPDDFDSRRKYSEILRGKGDQFFFSNKYQKAIEVFNRAREINEKLYAERPDDPQIAEQYAYIFIAIGEAQNWNNDQENSEKSLQKGLEMLIPLGAKYPNDHKIQRSLILAYGKTAALYQDIEDYQKSIEFYEKDLETAQKMLAADPLNFQAKRDVAIAYKRLAEPLDYAGKSRESAENLKLALEKFQELAAADSNNVEAGLDIANTRFSLGETYLSLKDYAAALAEFTKARDEFEKYLAVKPSDGGTRRMSSFNLTRIGISYAGLAEKADRKENLQNALENFRAGLDRLYELKSEGSLGKIDDEEISSIEKQTEKVRSQIGK